MIDKEPQSFRYIPNTARQKDQMLNAVGASSIRDLFPDIPDNLYNPQLDLPTPLTEMELDTEMRRIANNNRLLPSFLGYGSYRRFQPSVVNQITSRDEFRTSYTPYQPEISQGTLQTAFEYQTMMSELYGGDLVSNTGMYDGPTAMAEAALMALKIKGSKDRRKVVALDTVHPNWRDVTKTYLSGRGAKLEIVSEENVSDSLEGAAALIVQSPNYLGNLEELQDLGERAHDKGALFIVSADPVSLGMLKAPGEYDADIAVGEGQSLGNPMHMGGVNLGIFTSKMEYVRRFMPGRIVGQTTEKGSDKTGYVLTLQPREQHIRRENATSNICTAEQLVALASSATLALLGPEGLRKLATLNYDKAHFLADKITKIPGYSLAFPENTFFNEFVVTCPATPTEINSYLLGEGIIGGKDVSNVVPNGMLLCATEMTTLEDVNKLVQALEK